MPRAGAVVSFGQAARHYWAWKGIDLHRPEILKPRQHEDATRIHKLVAALGKERLADIAHATLVATANKLHGHHTAQARNREVMTPAAAILHYARVAAAGVLAAGRSVQAAETQDPRHDHGGRQRAGRGGAARSKAPAVRQGTRISNTLKIAWSGDRPHPRHREVPHRQDRYLDRASARRRNGRGAGGDPEGGAHRAAVPVVRQEQRLLLARPRGCARAPRAAI